MKVTPGETTVRPLAAPHAEDARTSGPAAAGPVFLLAPARSFSTVSLALLAGHPRIYGFPEMLLFSTSSVHGLLNESPSRPEMPDSWLRNRLSGVLRAVADLHDGSQDPESVRRALEWLHAHEHWTTIQLMEHLMQLAQPRICLEKSPDTTHTDERLEACISAFPSARFIHLTRHPVTTQASMHRHMSWDRSDPLGLVIRSASSWYLAHLRIAKRLKSLPAERWTRVRAEDLLREPRTVLPQLCQWLGIPCDDDIVARMLRTDQWRFAGRGEDGNLFGGDAKFMHSPALRQVPAPGPVEFDPAWGLDPGLIRRMVGLAHYLGY